AAGGPRVRVSVVGGGRRTTTTAERAPLRLRRGPAAGGAVPGGGAQATEVVEGVSLRRDDAHVDPFRRHANPQEVRHGESTREVGMGSDGVELDVAATAADDVQDAGRGHVLAAR